MNRRRSWTFGESEEVVRKAALDLSEGANKAAGTKAHRDELGARERADSGFSETAIALRISRARASTSGSSDTASMTVNLSKEERLNDKFPDQEEDLIEMDHGGTSDDIIICLCQSLHNDGTRDDTEISVYTKIDLTSRTRDILLAEAALTSSTLI